MSIKNLLCYFGVGSFLISSLVAKPTIQWQGNSENNDVKLSINNTSTSIQENINYRQASYIALTLDKAIDDTYVIQYGDERLKVLYVTSQGRYKQVFLNSI